MHTCAGSRHPVLLLAALATGLALTAAAPAGGPSDPVTPQELTRRIGGMPLLFVADQVAPDGATGFVVRGSHTSVWLGPGGLTYRLSSRGGVDGTPSAWTVALDLVGGSPRQPVGEDLLPTRVSYFKGPKEQWRTGLPSYGSVVYREAWQGVDLVVSGADGDLKSSFVVRPGADPSSIRLGYRGASGVRFEPDGSLVVETPHGDITEQPPVAYQEIGGRRVEVSAAFSLEPASEREPDRRVYRFWVGDHDPTRVLVVDPITVVSSGFIGGSNYDAGYAIAVDDAGNTYVTGETLSTEATFPVTVGPDLTYNGGTEDYGDVFVAKVNADGTALDYCGYIGGGSAESAFGIAVDANGSAYVTGHTSSSDFPVTVGPDLTYGGLGDAFVAKIDASGTALDYCGYIGGSSSDWGYGIDVDDAGSAYVTGHTSSTEATFPVNLGPDLTYNGLPDAFVAKVSITGAALEYCGYIGGNDSDLGKDLAVDASGRAYITGYTGSTEASFPVIVGPDLSHNQSVDAFVARVASDGSDLEYCGYIGGRAWDEGNGVAVDGGGNAYVTGMTGSTEMSFPVTVGPDLDFSAFWEAFVAKVNAAGTALDYCGYIGGSSSDFGYGIAVDASGNAYVTGQTESTEASFPVAVGPDLSHNGGTDAFVARVNANGTALDYCGYVGGSSSDVGAGIAVDNGGTAHLAGWTASTEYSFPVARGPDLTHNGFFDVFVMKLAGFVFGDGFESGDTTAWSLTVP